MSQRCIWSHERDGHLKEITLEVPSRFGSGLHAKTVFVDPEYEEELRSFAAYVRRYARFFVAAISALTLASIGSGIAHSPIAGGACIFLMGMLLLVFPFSTPETVKMLGLRRSITLARSIGALLLAMGVALPIMV